MEKDCELCQNLQATCNLHKPKETKEDREIRRKTFIGFALSKNLGAADEEDVMQEAGEMFDRVNPPIEE